MTMKIITHRAHAVGPAYWARILIEQIICKKRNKPSVLRGQCWDTNRNMKRWCTARYRKRGLTFWAKVREKHGRRRKGLRSKRLIDLTFYIGSTPTVYISTCNTKSGLKKMRKPRIKCTCRNYRFVVLYDIRRPPANLFAYKRLSLSWWYAAGVTNVMTPDKYNRDA